MTTQFAENKTRLDLIKKKLDITPESPGVYLHKNKNNEILYVGKAKNLKARLKSYFTSIDQHPLKTKALVDKIVDFDVIVTQNEYESLLLENNLIKHNLPPYNILLRDDKTYPYIKITTNEEWPRVFLTRKRKKDEALYFGPYTIPGQVTQLLNIIQRFFPLVKCTPNIFKNVTRPCNYYDIKKCLAPCKLQVNKNEYNDHLKNVISILNGNTLAIEKQLKQKMQEESNNLNFEKASILRDQYKSLVYLNENQSVTLINPIFMDLISYFWSESQIVFYISFIRNGNLVGGKFFNIENFIYDKDELSQQSKLAQVCSSFLGQYYSKKEIPDIIFITQSETLFSKEHLEILNHYIIQENERIIKNSTPDSEILFQNQNLFSKFINKKFKISKLDNFKETFTNLVTISIKNAENKYQELIKMNENHILALQELKQILNLITLPRRIECFDISTFQGFQTVASQVVFKDGQSAKSSYRKYIIKEILDKSDDFASLREVIRRRFKNSEPPADLIIIDGGTPQIREVGLVLKSLGIENIPYVGLAKSRVLNHFSQRNSLTSEERFILPPLNSEDFKNDDNFKTIPLKLGLASSRLVMQIRDEAHRFAIQFHRKKRDEYSIKSNILNIAGLGKVRKKILLQKCPNIYDLQKIDLQELSKETKIPLKILIAIKENLAH